MQVQTKNVNHNLNKLNDNICEKKNGGGDGKPWKILL